MKWKEDKDYARARNPKLGVGYHVKLCLFWLAASTLFSFGLWALAGYKAEVVYVLMGSMIMPLVAIPVFLRASRGPASAELKEHSLEVGGESVTYRDLTSVRLGNATFENTTYPVVSFVIRNEYELVMGLPNEGYFDTLESFFRAKKIEVER